jgi:DNA-binding LacI/PurR family transcriptional regulator
MVTCARGRKGLAVCPKVGSVKRPTIADLAREAGVSKGAVSYALNGQPGVSEATRERIVAIADRIGFRASSAARALAGAPAKVVGLALQRPASTLGVEPFFMELVSGLEAELSIHSYALLLQMVPDERDDAETEIYRQWRIESRVDGVLLCDVRVDDPRVAAVHEMGLPAVVIGPPIAGGPLASIWSDDAVSMTEAFTTACDRLGLGAPAMVWTDYSGEDGAAATRALLGSAEPPTAIIYDNDIMAVAALSAAQELGRVVPDDLSIIAWDDSPVCPLVHPPLTALTRDIGAYGTRAARLLLAAIAGEPVADLHDEPAHLTIRRSTAPPPS